MGKIFIIEISTAKGLGKVRRDSLICSDSIGEKNNLIRKKMIIQVL
jgi:hypothetical protein